MNYYNENDPKAAAWLRELIKASLIPAGEVDERSIVDVKAGDLVRFIQCHFFAGIGGWAHALKLAGWPEDRPAWTGSCPCQPFSCAGKGLGESDARHLWPQFKRLISECSPPVVFGEQTASALGRLWLARVRADLEAMAYGVGAADLCAAGIGAPHIRQRLYWMAYANGRHASAEGLQRIGQQRHGAASRDDNGTAGLDKRAEAIGLANTQSPERRGEQPAGGEGRGRGGSSGNGFNGEAGRLENTSREGPPSEQIERQSRETETSHAGARSFTGWSDAIWHECRDGKTRRISPEPAFFPLAPSVPGRVGKLRGYGNSIVPPLAEVFIRSCVEAIADQ